MVIVKVFALLTTLSDVVTVTFTVPLPDGTKTTMPVFDHVLTEAVTEPNFTEPWVVPKLVPTIVTVSPGLPLEGVSEEITGLLNTVMFEEASHKFS